jgi:DNA-binding NtrC family response regulator
MKAGLRRDRILVVDEAKNQRELYRLILEDAGYEVTATQDGEQALLLARENHFDLVLTDDKTTGTGGIMLTIELSKQNPSAFVLTIITGGEKMLTHGSSMEIEKALRGAMFGFLEKPVDRMVLLRVVESAIYGLK